MNDWVSGAADVRLALTGEVESVHVGRLRRIPAECLAEHVARRRAAQQPPDVAAKPEPRARRSIWARMGAGTAGLPPVYREDGSLDRRHVRGQTKGVVVVKVRELERQRDEGRVRRAGPRWTLGAWLEHWLENIARPDLRETSYAASRTAVVKHIRSWAKHRLDRLEPEHLERLYRTMVSEGAKPATPRQVHRTLRTALGAAQRRGHVSRERRRVREAA